MKRLKIEIRTYQYKHVNGSNLIWQAGASGLELVSGTNPALGTFAPNAWINVTEYVDKLQSATFSWDTITEESGTLAPTNAKKGKVGFSEALIFKDFASDLLRAWITNNGAVGINNMFEVKISYMVGGPYQFPPYLISWRSISNQITSPNNKDYKIVLREDNRIVQKLDSMNIAKYPNKLGNDYFSATSTTKHPRFFYGTKSKGQAKTNFIMLSILFMLPTLWVYLASAPFRLWIFRAIFGTGKAHPAPFIRTYLQNICDECDLVLDTTIFDNSPTSSTLGWGSVFGDSNSPYYNECFMCHNAVEGVSNDNTGPGAYYIRENAPLLTASDFLNLICKQHLIQWTVINGTLYIGKKEYIHSVLGYVFDFTDLNQSAKIENAIDLQFVAKKIPATLEFKYGQDSQESAGNYYKPKFEDNVSLIQTTTFEDAENLPFFGIETVSNDKIACVAHSTDKGENNTGIADYIRLVLSDTVIIATFSSPFYIAMKYISDTEQEANDYMILDSETGDLYKTLIWDPYQSPLGNDIIDMARIKVPSPAADNPLYQDASTYQYNYANFPLAYNAAKQDNLFWFFGQSLDYAKYPPKEKSIEIVLSSKDFYGSLDALGAFSGAVYNGLMLIKLPNGEDAIIQSVNIDFGANEIKLSCKTKY